MTHWYRLEVYATTDGTPTREEVYPAPTVEAARIAASEFVVGDATGLLYVDGTVTLVAVLGAVSAS